MYASQPKLFTPRIPLTASYFLIYSKHPLPIPDDLTTIPNFQLPTPTL